MTEENFSSIVKHKIDKDLLSKYKIYNNNFFILDFEAIQEGRANTRNNLYRPYHAVSFSIIKHNKNSLSYDFFHNFSLKKNSKFDTQFFLIEKLLEFYGDSDWPIIVWSKSLEVSIINFWIDLVKNKNSYYYDKLNFLKNKIVDLQLLFTMESDNFSISNTNKSSLSFISEKLDFKINDYEISSRECSENSLNIYKLRKVLNRKKINYRINKIKIHNTGDTDKILYLVNWLNRNLVK